MNTSLQPTQHTAPQSQFVKPDILGIVVKITERCNLACPYCYFFYNGDESHKEHPPFMGMGTVRQVIEFIRKAVTEQGIRFVRIGLHGGEPMLLKKEKFAEMCEAFRSELDPICNLLLVIQTNGILVSREWIELFSRYQVRVSVSIDGDEAVHNIFRITKKGKGTYAETRRGWNMLNQAMADGELLSAAILCVISPQQSGAAIYRHMTKELKAPAVNFLLPDITHDSHDANQRFIDGCGDFLIEVFDAWAADGGTKGSSMVRFIHEAIGPMINDELCRRSVRKLQPLLQFNVSSNGEVSPDDVIRGIAPRFRDLPYRIDTHHASELSQRDEWQELERVQMNLPTPCQQCEWKNVCRGGNYQSRYSEKNGFDNPSVYCSALKRYYGHVAKHIVAAGFPAEEIRHRLTRSFD